MQRLYTTLKNILLNNPNKPLYWIILALLIKAVFFAYFLVSRQYSNDEIRGFIGATTGDYYSYIGSIENFINKGIYSPDHRMPGYGIIYLFFRLFFKQGMSLNIMIFLQYILYSISIYYLAIIGMKLFNSNRVFYLTYYLNLAIIFPFMYEIYTQPECFTIASLIFSIYYFVKFSENRKSNDIFYSGILFAWTIFLRPIFLPVFAIYGFLIFISFIRKKITLQNVIKYYIIISLPFIVFDSAWTLRNYKTYHKIIFLQKSMYYQEQLNYFEVDLIKFIQSWGGDATYWNPKAEIRWFNFKNSDKNEAILDTKDVNETLPDYIYTTKFNSDSLLKLKGLIADYFNIPANTKQKTTLSNCIRNKLQDYTLSIKTERPFLYCIIAPSVLFKKFLIHQISFTNTKGVSFIKKISKDYYNFMYNILIILCLISFLFIAFLKKYDVKLIVHLIVIYIFIVFPVFLRFVEYRYIIPVIPLIILCASYCIDEMYKIISEIISNKHTYKGIPKGYINNQ